MSADFLDLVADAVVEQLDQLRGRGRLRTLDADDVLRAIRAHLEKVRNTRESVQIVTRARCIVANSYGLPPASDVVEIVSRADGMVAIFAGRGRARAASYGKGELVLHANERARPRVPAVDFSRVLGLDPARLAAALDEAERSDRDWREVLAETTADASRA